MFFFQQLYCITIVLHLYLEIMCMHFILSSHHISSHIYATLNVITNLQYNFPKMRGGGGQRPFGFGSQTPPSVTCHLHEQAFSSWCKYLKKNRKDSQELQTRVQTLFELQRHIDDIPPRVFTSSSEPILGASIFNLRCRGRAHIT